MVVAGGRPDGRCDNLVLWGRREAREDRLTRSRCMGSRGGGGKSRRRLGVVDSRGWWQGEAGQGTWDSEGAQRHGELGAAGVLLALGWCCGAGQTGA